MRNIKVLSLDGGGYRGLAIVEALAKLAQYLKLPLRGFFDLAVGTSTGSIIAASLAHGLPAEEIRNIYLKTGPDVFKPGLTSRPPLSYFVDHTFNGEAFREFLARYLDNALMSDAKLPLVIPFYEGTETRKLQFAKDTDDNPWLMRNAVYASCVMPHLFPYHQKNGNLYADGGIGGASNPVFYALMEALHWRGWTSEPITIVRLGTGISAPPLKHQPLATGVDDLIYTLIAASVEQQNVFVETQAALLKKTAGIDIRFINLDINAAGIAPDDVTPKAQIHLLREGAKMGQRLIDALSKTEKLAA